MDATLARFASRLKELGIEVKFHSMRPNSHQRGKVRLSRGGSAQSYTMIHGSSITFADVARAGGAELPALVLTTYATPRTADALRRAGVQYLDAAGNAWIRFGEVLVDVRGRPRTDHERLPKRGAGNLFSAGRAQVVFALLAWPELWHASRREAAHAAGVSLGQAHNALALLAEAGYGSDDVRPGQTPLLALWAAAFPAGLATKLTLATFHGDVDELRVVSADDVAYLSGEKAASELLRPATLTLYVRKLNPRLPIVNRWRTDQDPNVVVRRAFWHAPHLDETDAGLLVAPWPLVYADLLASDNPRVRDTAEEWKKRHVRPE
jgi:hypothetical protein